MGRRLIRTWGSSVAALVLAFSVLVPDQVGASTRDPAWVRAFLPPNAAIGTSVALDPSGSTLYLGGSTQAPPNELVVRAYDAPTGTRVWAAAIACSTVASHTCWLGSVAVSPDGGTLYVAGVDVRQRTSMGVTLALDSATGAQRWVARLAGGSTGTSRLAVSPTGDRIFVSGAVGSSAHPGERVVAYDAATGAMLWRFREPGYADVPYLAVTPDGTLVVAPPVADRRRSRDVVLTALDAATGSTVWLRRSGAPRIYDSPAGLGMDPGGNVVILTDYREAFRDPVGRPSFTLAFRVADGKRLWTKAEDAFFAASTMSIPVAAGGGRVFLTDGDVTIARGLGDGRLLWGRATGPGIPWWSYAWAAVLTPHADRVFVADSVCDEGTMGHCWLSTTALDAASGHVRWTAHRARGAGAELVAGPSGERVYEGGWVTDEAFTFLGTLAVAYRG